MSGVSLIQSKFKLLTEPFVCGVVHVTCRIAMLANTELPDGRKLFPPADGGKVARRILQLKKNCKKQ